MSHIKVMAVLLSQYRKPRFFLMATHMILMNRNTKKRTVISSSENGKILDTSDKPACMTG
jgi:hypothetical protein